MSALLLVHPKMSGLQVEELARTCSLLIEVERKRVVLVPKPSSAFYCIECKWEGDEPEVFNFETLCLPSIADIPICPRCEGFVYRRLL